MKSQDTEGPYELYVTRTPGYLWAVLFNRLGVHPNVVTLTSYVLGIASGVLFYFDDLRLNIIGMFLLIWANWYDCADGQLARMSHKCSLIGRVLDGFGGDVWFFAIYVSISLRLTPTWGIWIWLLCSLAGFYCHAHQAAVGDYYRNIHMFFELGASRSELTTYKETKAKFESLHWNRQEWFEKLYLFFYSRYTHGQESQTPEFQKFYSKLRSLYPDGNVPEDLRKNFRQESKPLMPMTNILNFETRVIVLFLSLLGG